MREVKKKIMKKKEGRRALTGETISYGSIIGHDLIAYFDILLVTTKIDE